MSLSSVIVKSRHLMQCRLGKKIFIESAERVSFPAMRLKIVKPIKIVLCLGALSSRRDIS